MKGKLEFKEELQGDGLVLAVYYNGVNCGIIRPKLGGGTWYRWGKIYHYDTELDSCKSFVIELFNQFDTFIESIK